MFTSVPYFVGFLMTVGGFGLRLEGCVAAVVIWALFQPRASVSVHVIGKKISGQLPLAHWFSAGVTLVPTIHLATTGCIFSCHSWAEDAFVMLWVEAKDTPRAVPIPTPTPKNDQNVYSAQAEKSCFNVFMEQLSFRESGN